MANEVLKRYFAQYAPDFDRERKAALVWSCLCEPQDRLARRITEEKGFFAALKEVDAAAKQSASEAGRPVTAHRGSIGSEIRHSWCARLLRWKGFDLSALRKTGTRFLLPSDPCWPQGLLYLGDTAPLSLWVKGNADVLKNPVISAVGSRDTTESGRRTALDFSYALAPGYVLCSGGAMGIDACVHRAALLHKRPTVVVSAGGVDRAYPRTHASLFREIEQCGGAVVSESPWGSAPQRHRFLSRNRIIAALGKGTVVFQAGIRSGALNTAHHAMSIGREVGAVPGGVDTVQFAGCNSLIREGATLISSVRDIYEMVEPLCKTVRCGGEGDLFFQSCATRPEDTRRDFDALAQRVFDAVPLRKACDVQTIAATAGTDIADTLIKLSKLQIRGRVRECDGLWKKQT